MPLGSEQSKVTPVIEKREVVYAPGYKEATESSEATSTQDASAKPVEGSVAADQPQEGTEAQKEPSKIEQRQMRLEESKLARKAREDFKRAEQARTEAKTLADKAEQFNQKLAVMQKDPINALQGMGIDPDAFYRQLTNAYLNPESIKKAIEPDPVETKVKQILNPYIQEREEEKARVAQHNQLVAETQVVHGDILPMITANKDNYEAVLAFNGNNEGAAAVAVYNKVKSHWFETAKIAEDGTVLKEGEVITFEDAANQLESFYYEQLEYGINTALGMKKFSSKYGQKENPLQPGSKNPASSEQTKQSKTLTNSKGAPAGNSSNQVENQSLSYGVNGRLERLMKKHNL